MYRDGAAGAREFLQRLFHHGHFTTNARGDPGPRGRAATARSSFETLNQYDQNRIIEFLKTLQVLPPRTRHLIMDENGNEKKWPPVRGPAANRTVWRTKRLLLGLLAANKVHKMVKFAGCRGTGVSPIILLLLRGRFGWDGWDQRRWTLFRPFRADSFGILHSQGVALGYCITPRWGSTAQRRTKPKVVKLRRSEME